MAKLVTLEQSETLAQGIAGILDQKKVEKVTGKGLSTNDYTQSDKTKLAGIGAGAQANLIEKIKVNGSAVSIQNKEVNLDLSTYATKADITAVYKVKGSKTAASALPSAGNIIGDVWNVDDTGANYVWTGSAWDKLSEVVDLTPYVKKTELTPYAKKTDLTIYATKAELQAVEVEEATELDIQNILNGLFQG